MRRSGLATGAEKVLKDVDNREQKTTREEFDRYVNEYDRTNYGMKFPIPVFEYEGGVAINCWQTAYELARRSTEEILIYSISDAYFSKVVENPTYAKRLSRSKSKSAFLAWVQNNEIRYGDLFVMRQLDNVVTHAATFVDKTLMFQKKSATQGFHLTTNDTASDNIGSLFDMYRVVKDFPEGEEKQTMVDVERTDGGFLSISTVHMRHIPLSLSTSGGWKIPDSWLGFARLTSDNAQYPGPRRFTYIRSGSLGSSIVASARKSVVLEVIGDEGDRHKINATAYVHNSVVDCREKCGTSLVTKDSAPASQGNVSGPNARLTPGGDIFGVLNNQQKFSIIGKSGAYYKINISGSVGKSVCRVM